MGKREPQNVRVEIVAQASQHDLAEDALANAQHVAHSRGNHHQYEKHPAQQKQELDLAELDIEQNAGKVTGLWFKRAIDDQLRQVEEQIEQRQVNQGADDQNELLPLTVPPDIGKDACWNRFSPCSCFGLAVLTCVADIFLC
jgi:hypothetical protein